MDTASGASSGDYIGDYNAEEVQKWYIWINGEQFEKCMICWDNICGNQMHEIRSCHHRYCYSCMSDHVEYMLRFHAGVPACPNEMCNLPLTEDDSKKFLSAKFFDKFMRRLEEAKIPDSQKLYCPYPNCSALMAAECLPEGSSSSSSSSHPFPTKECRECHRLFCIECRVPWHTGVSCQVYTSQFGRPDVELHMLAEENKWRSCPTCKHLIERSEGCDKITCRCGSEFCYHCGCLYVYWNGIEKCDCTDLTIFL